MSFPIRLSSRRPRSFLGDPRGTSAVEFSLLLPVFALLLVGAIDFGGVLFKKFRLNSAVTAGANYALVNAGKVDGTNGATLAGSIASLMASADTAESTTGTIVVNNGPTATLTAGGTTAGGTAANANSCYCPSASASGVVWGTARTCGSACTGGAPAGKFVSIVVSQAYIPSFSNYGIVENGAITSTAVVQAQ